MDKTNQITQKSLTEDQITRIFTHRQHLIDNFYNRLNSFLVFESVLLGIIGILYTKNASSLLMLKLIAILGFTTTILWWYTQERIRSTCQRVTLYAKDIMPEYREMLSMEGKI